MKTPVQEVLYFYNELVSYKYFIALSERHWAEDFEQYEQSLRSEDDALLCRFNHRADLSASLKSEFPQHQRRAYLMMLLAMFEDFLNQFCQSIKEHYGVLIEVSDFSGMGIERAKKYLTKATPLNFPSGTPEWDNLKKAQKIRNVIAHAAGYIDPEKHSEQQKIVSTSDYIDSENYARVHIVLSSQYILEIIGDMKSFSNRLIALSEKMPNNQIQPIANASAD
jgi:hypothetical protein